MCDVHWVQLCFLLIVFYSISLRADDGSRDFLVRDVPDCRILFLTIACLEGIAAFV